MWLMLAAPWLFAILRPFTRTRRFLGFLAVTTILIWLGASLDRPIGQALEILVAASWLVAFLLPARMRLGALSNDEVDLDVLLRKKLDVASGRRGDGFATDTTDSASIVMRAATHDRAWYQVATLVDSLSRPVNSPGALRRDWVDLAARHVLHDVSNRNVIGRRPIAGPWDYDVYLHVQLDREKSSTTQGEALWIASEIEESTSPDRAWSAVRDGLVELIRSSHDPSISKPFMGTSVNGVPTSLGEAWRLAQAKYRGGTDLDQAG